MQQLKVLHIASLIFAIVFLEKKTTTAFPCATLYKHSACIVRDARKQRQDTHTWLLEMGKGFNSARNKQAALARKMEIAKEQYQMESSSKATAVEEVVDEEAEQMRIEEEEQRAIFSELLAKNQPMQQPKQQLKRPISSIDSMSAVPSTFSTQKPTAKSKNAKRKRKVAIAEKNEKKKKREFLFLYIELNNVRMIVRLVEIL